MADYSVRATLSAVDKGFRSTFESCQKVGERFEKSISSGLGFGIMQAAGMKAFSAIENGLKASVKAGADFDTATSQIAATMGKEKSEISDIISEAKRLGSETSFSATQAAEGFNILAMAGLDAEQQIAAAGDVLNLAAAGAEDMDAAASQVTGTLKGFNQQIDGTINGVKSSQYVADMLAKGAALANTDVNMLGNALADTAATANSYGQDMQGVTKNLLKLAEGNVRGEKAATMLNRAMADVYTPTSNAKKALDALGVSAYDAEGNARNFEDVTDDLQRALSGMSEEEANAYKNTIFTTNGLQAFNKIASVSEATSEKFQKGLEGASDGIGAAAEMAATQLDNLEGDVTLFGSALEGLEITVFNELSGAMRGAVQTATDMVSALDKALQSKSFEDFVTNAKKYLDVFMDGAIEVKDAFGEAFSAIGDSLSELNGSFGSAKSVSSFADAVDVAVSALKGFAGFLTEHSDQIAWLISQIPKLVIAFAGFKIVTAVLPGLQMVGGIFMTIGSSVAGLAGKLLGLVPGLGTVAQTSSVTGTEMLKAAGAFALMGVGVLTLATGFALLAQSAIALSNAGAGAIAVFVGMVGLVALLGVGMSALLKTLAPVAPTALAIGGALLMIGGAIVLVSVGFALLAQSAIALSEAGSGAVATFALMVAGIAGLVAVFALLGPALTAGAVGFVALGAAILLAGAGAVLAGAGLNLVAMALPSLVQYGTQGAVAITMLGASLVTFGAGATVAGASLLVLSAGLVALGASSLVASAGMVALGAGIVIAGAGVLMCSAGFAILAGVLPAVAVGAQMAVPAFTVLSGILITVVASAGALTGVLIASTASLVAFDASAVAGAVSAAALAVALTAVTAEMSSIASNASKASADIAMMESSTNIVSAALDTMGTLAESAMSALKSAFKSAESDIVSTASSMANNSTRAISEGLRPIPANTNAVMSQMAVVFAKTGVAVMASGNVMMAGYSRAIQSHGARSVGIARSTTNSIVNAFASGRSGAYRSGSYIGQGLASGMSSQLSRVRAVASQLSRAAISAINAAAKVHSPSEESEWTAGMIAQGLINAFHDNVNRVRKAAARLYESPERVMRDLAGMSTDMASIYDYTGSAEFVINVPLEINGREFARATAEDTYEVQSRLNRNENRKRGGR